MGLNTLKKNIEKAFMQLFKLAIFIKLFGGHQNAF